MPVVTEVKMPDIDIKSDLLFGVMNLIEIEEHCHGSFITTNDERFLEIKNLASELRKKYTPKIEKEENSQLHCINKHLLSASFRLWEVGDKHWRDGDSKIAIECYKDSSKLLNKFVQENWKDD